MGRARIEGYKGNALELIGHVRTHRSLVSGGDRGRDLGREERSGTEAMWRKHERSCSGVENESVKVACR